MRVGTFAAEHLPPAFPERAARGTAGSLRAWQQEALDAYLARDRRDFLVAATPGAGKTTFALRVATELIARRLVDRITVVAPTEHLKGQWADAAHHVGIRLNPAYRNGESWAGRRFHGMAVSYAQVAMNAALHRRITESHRTLVILDEVHHGGDALSWGDAIREAFDPAVRRLSLSGTPFRSDSAAIPFVGYAPDAAGIRTSVTDYSYGYGRALADGVVRPVLFMAYAGRMRWRTRDGEEMEARLGQGDTKDVTAQAWRTALDPAGEFMPNVLAAADRRLTEVRAHIPDAGGLVIAGDQGAARAYADILHRVSGEPPTVVLSDERESSARIERFARGDDRWLVAVRMVSEGVDVPRLCVGVYATPASTPLFFAQAIGRFVRARRRGETASVFLPSVPVLLELGAQLERERDHALDRDAGDALYLDDAALERANVAEPASASVSEGLAETFEWAALESDANFSHVMFEGEEFGFAAAVLTEEEEDFLGLPGILEPGEVRELLRQRQLRQSRRAEGRAAAERAAGADAAGAPEPALHRTLKEQRTLLNSLVGMRAKLSGQPHGMIHSELRRVCGGPPVAQATVAQLQSRIEHLRRTMHT
ncbi:MAG: DEAD/DEAH box helicase [Microbacteriaceae bacterium]